MWWLRTDYFFGGLAWDESFVLTLRMFRKNIVSIFIVPSVCGGQGGVPV